MQRVRNPTIFSVTTVSICLLLVTWMAVPAQAADPQIIRVGPEREIKTPSAAAAIATDGAIIEIDAGVYPKDAAVWRQNNLTLRGVGGRAHLRSEGTTVEGKAIWVIKGHNTRVENIEFSGARVKDRNGAGIRQQGNGLTVVGCSFHDNENGILSGKQPESVIFIDRTEFANNGQGDGRTHNIYIGHAKSFTLQHSYVHHANAGHNVKTRAAINRILYNRIMDEGSGNSSYALDFSEGGQTLVIGNSIQQGPETENSTLVHFSRESNDPPGQLQFIHNTIVNDRHTGIFIKNRSPKPALVVNNIFVGKGKALVGTGELKGNLLVRASAPEGVTGNPTASKPGFLDVSAFDYRLAAGSAAVDRALEAGARFAEFEYVHEAGGRPRPRVEAPDIGAFEFEGR
jgi:hypothetical protein